MAITTAFQAVDRGSIPLTRSMICTPKSGHSLYDPNENRNQGNKKAFCLRGCKDCRGT